MGVSLNIFLLMSVHQSITVGGFEACEQPYQVRLSICFSKKRNILLKPFPVLFPRPKIHQNMLSGDFQLRNMSGRTKPVLSRPVLSFHFSYIVLNFISEIVGCESELILQVQCKKLPTCCVHTPNKKWQNNHQLYSVHTSMTGAAVVCWQSYLYGQPEICGGECCCLQH